MKKQLVSVHADVICSHLVMSTDYQPSDRTSDERLSRFMLLCRKAKLKVTPQRVEIYRALAETDEHPDAETVFRRVKPRLPAISFNTVYQTLKKLQEKGLILRVDTPLERARFDADLTAHHHFVCEQCGAIRDFRCRSYDGLTAPHGVGAIGIPRLVRVEVRGVCHQCGSGKARRNRDGTRTWRQALKERKGAREKAIAGSKR